MGPSASMSSEKYVSIGRSSLFMLLMMRSCRSVGRIRGMTPQQCAAACKRPVMELGAAFGICAATQQRARQLGLSAWSFYVAGRGGALGGDVRTDTVAAALGFVAPDAVRSGWEEGRRVGPVSIANHSLAEWCRFGAEVFAPMPRVDRLVSLAER